MFIIIKESIPCEVVEHFKERMHVIVEMRLHENIFVNTVLYDV